VWVEKGCVVVVVCDPMQLEVANGEDSVDRVRNKPKCASIKCNTGAANIPGLESRKVLFWFNFFDQVPPSKKATKCTFLA
jgi:hypothetical protein